MVDRILVTGGAGFIGSNFIRYVLQAYPGIHVLNLDKLTYAGNLDNLKDLENNSRYRFVQGDICDADIVDRCVSQDIDAIVNFAAETHVDRSILSAGDFVQTDVFGVYVLLEAVRRHNVARFMQISTDEVYGSIETGSFREEDPLQPNSPYSAAKASGEMLVRSYFITYGVQTLVTRSSNNYGPYQYPEKLIPLFITNALENQELPLYGDGLNVRDWIHVKDNCRAIDTVLRRGVPGQAYNIAAGEEYANRAITEQILRLLNKPPSLIRYVTDRPGHDRRYSIACDKIRRLGWTPGIRFAAGLDQTVAWYREQESWWRQLKARRREYEEYYRQQYGSRL